MSHATASRVRRSQNIVIVALYHFNMLIENSTVYETEIPFVEIESMDEVLRPIWMLKCSNTKAKAMTRKDPSSEPSIHTKVKYIGIGS